MSTAPPGSEQQMGPIPEDQTKSEPDSFPGSEPADIIIVGTSFSDFIYTTWIKPTSRRQPAEPQMVPYPLIKDGDQNPKVPCIHSRPYGWCLTCHFGSFPATEEPFAPVLPVAPPVPTTPDTPVVCETRDRKRGRGTKVEPHNKIQGSLLKVQKLHNKGFAVCRSRCATLRPENVWSTTNAKPKSMTRPPPDSFIFGPLFETLPCINNKSILSVDVTEKSKEAEVKAAEKRKPSQWRELIGKGGLRAQLSFECSLFCWKLSIYDLDLFLVLLLFLIVPGL